MENKEVENQETETSGMSRRDFLKVSGAVAGTAAVAGGVTACVNAAFAKTHDSIDDMYRVTPAYELYHQRREMFCRFEWDPQFLPNPAPLVTLDTPGFSQLDLAAGQAAWALANGPPNTFGWRSGNEGHFSWFPLGVTRPAPRRWEASEEEGAHIIKLYANQSLPNLTHVGISLLDPRWVYTGWYHRGNRTEGEIVLSNRHTAPEIAENGTRYIPTSMKYVINMLQSMPYDAGQTSPYAVGGIGAGVGYSSGVHQVAVMAEFIRGLGYHAIPSVGCTANNVPLGIAAGQGELGRHGLLISPYGGARVRSVKVITDMPLALDKPISFGVKEFCMNCKKCADACPQGAISHGPPTTNGPSAVSNAHGVEKWYIDPEACRVLWNHHSGIPCMRCVSACAYNKPDGFWTHDPFGYALAPVVGGGVMAAIDDWMGYGQLKETRDFWKIDLKKSRGINV